MRRGANAAYAANDGAAIAKGDGCERPGYDEAAVSDRACVSECAGGAREAAAAAAAAATSRGVASAYALSSYSSPPASP